MTNSLSSPSAAFQLSGMKKRKTVEDPFQAAKETNFHIADMMNRAGRGDRSRNGPQSGSPEASESPRRSRHHEVVVCAARIRKAPSATPSNRRCKMNCTGVNQEIHWTVVTQVWWTREDPAFK